MRKFICDICGREIGSEDTPSGRWGSDIRLTEPFARFGEEPIDWDLCDGCRITVRRVLLEFKKLGSKKDLK